MAFLKKKREKNQWKYNILSPPPPSKPEFHLLPCTKISSPGRGFFFFSFFHFLIFCVRIVYRKMKGVQQSLATLAQQQRGRDEEGKSKVLTRCDDQQLSNWIKRTLSKIQIRRNGQSNDNLFNVPCFCFPVACPFSDSSTYWSCTKDGQ